MFSFGKLLAYTNKYLSKEKIMKLNELKLEVDYFEFDEKYYHKVNPTPLKNPKLVSFNPLACDLINLDYSVYQTQDFVDFINGSKILDGSTPYAMAYAGHQFGYFVPQLGDGRAINLGAVNNWHLQTKVQGLLDIHGKVMDERFYGHQYENIL